MADGQNQTTNRTLNKLSYAMENVAADVSTAATGDYFMIFDADDNYEAKYCTGDNVLEAAGVTSTAAELNILDGVTATAAELNMAADSSANTEVVTTTNVITAAESGKTFILNSATAFVSTLPAVAAGLRYKFYIGATIVTGGNHTIVPTDDNTIYGQCIVNGAAVAASAEGSINLIADNTLPGDWLDVFCDGTNWYVGGQFVTASSLTFTT